MKIIVVTSLFLACVAARGSGPYLPSGWKPDGPSFYLPSETSKPKNEPVKEVTFSESEASGSDFLREYGPPKVQEVSQDISQQGLPDVVNDQLFVKTVVETIEAKENSNAVTSIAEEKLEVNAEVKAAEETVAVTEDQVVIGTESIKNVEESVQLKDETTTLANTVGSVDAVYEFGYIVEPTEAVVVPTEIIQTSVQLENQALSNTIIELQQITKQEQEPAQGKIVESATANAFQVTGAEQLNSDISEQTETLNVESTGISVTQQPDIGFEIISTFEKKVETGEEEVKKVENIVQNIPEVIVSLENEIKSQQAETTQEVPAAILEIFGSLDKAPEGFLEYGPPGFREYGPPKEELRDNTIEEQISETQPIENSASRRRRFSPKFRSSVNSH